jgi:hypothetical protein
MMIRIENQKEEEFFLLLNLLACELLSVWCNVSRSR